MNTERKRTKDKISAHNLSSYPSDLISSLGLLEYFQLEQESRKVNDLEMLFTMFASTLCHPFDIDSFCLDSDSSASTSMFKDF